MRVGRSEVRRDGMCARGAVFTSSPPAVPQLLDLGYTPYTAGLRRRTPAVGTRPCCHDCFADSFITVAVTLYRTAALARAQLMHAPGGGARPKINS